MPTSERQSKGVQGMNAGRLSVTFVTKTGVAHFALQFWQLKKTDHFLNVCFAIFFSEFTLKLEYTKCS